MPAPGMRKEIKTVVYGNAGDIVAPKVFSDEALISALSTVLYLELQREGQNRPMESLNTVVGEEEEGLELWSVTRYWDIEMMVRRSVIGGVGLRRIGK